MIKALAYCRVSTTDQANNGVSLAAQAERVQAYCSLKGIDLVDVIIDEGVSAAKPLADRPAGSRVLAAIKAREVQAVVSVKLDRLFRNAVDCGFRRKRTPIPSECGHLVLGAEREPESMKCPR